MGVCITQTSATAWGTIFNAALIGVHIFIIMVSSFPALLDWSSEQQKLVKLPPSEPFSAVRPSSLLKIFIIHLNQRLRLDLLHLDINGRSRCDPDGLMGAPLTVMWRILGVRSVNGGIVDSQLVRAVPRAAVQTPVTLTGPLGPLGSESRLYCSEERMWGPSGQGSTDLLLLMSRSMSRLQWHNAFLPCHKPDTEARRDKRGNMTGVYHEKRATDAVWAALYFLSSADWWSLTGVAIGSCWLVELDEKEEADSWLLFTRVPRNIPDSFW